MKKNIVQDVIPGKRSIRNLTLESRGASVQKIQERDIKKAPKKEIYEEEEFTRPVPIQTAVKKEAPMKIGPSEATFDRDEDKGEPPSYTYEYVDSGKKGRKGLYIVVALLVIVGSFAVSALFKSAVIRVTPKEDTKTLNETFVAKKDSTIGLGFQVVSITKDAEKGVTAGSEEKVEKKATGKIVIYNGTAQVQKLVATTRFQTPEGLVFRLVSPANVPAKTVKDGKDIAGTVEAVVEADKTGVAYNIGLKDFTIPGFKNDPKFTTVYGRSKTEMTGGFSGMQKVVSKEIKADTEKELEGTLKATLANDITSQIPENFVLYSTSLTYAFEPATQIEGGSGTVILRKKGTASALIFEKGALTRAILAKVAPDLTSDMVKISNLGELTFAFSGQGAFDPAVNTTANISLEGTAKLVWVFDENKLKNDLLGLSKTNAKTVLGTYGAIKEAWVETHPFWNSTIPKNAEKVTFTNTLAI